MIRDAAIAMVLLACSAARADSGSAEPAAGGGSSASGGSAGDADSSAGSGGIGAGGTGGASAGGIGTGGASASGTGGSTGIGIDQGLVDYLGDPAFPDDFWEPTTFEAAQVDEVLIQAALDEIAASDWNIHSILIAKSGRLVVERYGFNHGQNPAIPTLPHQVLADERQPTFSTTKSFLSALIGIALDAGQLSSLDTTVTSYFPDYADLNPSAEKDRITLEDLLTMRSGLEWTEGDQTTFAAPDPARAMFSRPVVDLPVGEVWNYSSGGSDILAEILRVATGETPLDYANDKLFGPIGIVDPPPPWEAGANGTHHGGWGLSLTSREMARFGQLYLDDGEWLGSQVVPAAWVKESTLPRCPTPWGGQYAYHFWVPDLGGFFNTLGAFGQVIYVNREHELVIVFTADLPSESADLIFRGLIADYILPAVAGRVPI